jgi:hypothetical protein
MNIVGKLAPLTRFKLEGSIRSFLSTIPGAIIFAIILMLNLGAKNNFAEMKSIDHLVSSFFIESIILGLILSFIPATLGGWVLASWIHASTDSVSKISGILRGIFTGGISMLGFDFIVATLFATMNHHPSLEMFLFYVITSTSIALIIGAWVGLQLTNKVLKNKSPNEQH